MSGLTSQAPGRGYQPGRRPLLEAARSAGAAQRRFPLLQVLVLAALVLYVGEMDGDFSWGGLLAPILLQASFLGVAAAGQTFVILLGGLDFSIAAYLVAGNLLVTHLSGLDHWNFALVALIVLALCLAGGSFSGWVCHRFGLEPLVVTLGMSSVVVGAVVGTDTRLLNGMAPGWLQTFTQQSSTTFGLPISPIVSFWIVLAAVITLILARTRPAGGSTWRARGRARRTWPECAPRACGPARTRPAR